MNWKWIVIVAAAVLGSACGGCEPDPTPLPDVDTGPDAGPAEEMGLTPEQEREAILAVPETETIATGVMDAPVQIVRTAGDVPHIYAETEADLYRAAGYVLGRDRFFEYDVASRLATGQLAELLGRFGSSADVDARGRGYGIVADGVLEYMDDETGARFDAFAEGINIYIDRVLAGELPPPSEYDLAAPLVGADEPSDLLRRADRATVAGFAAFAVYESSYVDHDLQRQAMVDQLEGIFADDDLRRAGIDDLLADTTPRHPISVAPGFGLNGEVPAAPNALFGRSRGVGVARDLPPLPSAMWERLAERRERSSLWFGTREQSDKGSNAWAVSSDQTADGSVLLAGDGHLALGVPTLFFQMGLDLTTFGDDDFRVMGLFLPGFPTLAVGTNGHLAWSQTYPRADVLDWYREELTLDASGLPETSLFQGEARALVQIDEEYFVKGVLGDDDQTIVYPRWETFDGRLIVEIEGRTVEDTQTEMLAAGESLVNVGGTWIVPGDLDEDGVVTAVSLDFTAFDIGNLGAAVNGLQRARDVETFQQQMVDFVGYAQNLIVADRSGTVGFATYTAMPCREYLPRDAEGVWIDGANPQLLLDGTQYGGFEVPVDENGRVDRSLSDGPYSCIYSFEEYPRVVKDSGWVVNANNDPHGGSFDGTLWNDPFYIGGPWVPGYRANAIVQGLESAVGEHDIETMAEIQAHHGSQLGVDFMPELLGAVEAARALSGQSDAQLEPHEIRLRDAYDAESEAFDEAATRLDDWVSRGASAASGVETFYNVPGDIDRDDAVATMIFNAWLRAWILRVFEDEQMRPVLQQPGRARGAMIRALRQLTEGRGEANPLGLSSWNEATGESIYFDDLTTGGTVERSEEAALLALSDAFAYLSSEPLSRANGGFGTMEMDQWLWGLRHRVVFDSILVSFAAGNPAVGAVAKEFAIDTTVLPLADDLDDEDPRRRLRWFPRPGDFFSVDAANPGFYGEKNFDYSDGPVMRMVVKLNPDGSVEGQNVVPGGQSGLTSSDHFADQAALWLANEALPIQFAPGEVAEAAVGREVLTP